MKAVFKILIPASRLTGSVAYKLCVTGFSANHWMVIIKHIISETYPPISLLKNIPLGARAMAQR